MSTATMFLALAVLTADCNPPWNSVYSVVGGRVISACASPWWSFQQHDITGSHEFHHIQNSLTDDLVSLLCVFLHNVGKHTYCCIFMPRLFDRRLGSPCIIMACTNRFMIASLYTLQLRDSCMIGTLARNTI